MNILVGYFYENSKSITGFGRAIVKREEKLTPATIHELTDSLVKELELKEIVILSITRLDDEEGTSNA